MSFICKAFLESGTVKYPGYHESQPAAEAKASELADKQGHPVYVYQGGPGGRMLKMVTPGVSAPIMGQGPFRHPRGRHRKPVES